MKFKFINKLNRCNVCLLLLIIFLLELNLSLVYGVAKNDREVSGFSKKTEINRDESVSYHFSNNIHFEIDTEVFTELEIKYNERIENRETSMDINNDKSISLQIEVERSMENFGASKNPKEPKQGENQLRSQYKCIYRIKSNSSIEKLKVTFKRTN